MNQPSQSDEQIRSAFVPGARGVVGVVDAVLELCAERRLQLVWRDGACSYREGNAAPAEPVAVALQKAVVRAIAARLAARCNEHVPGSVSPYGGAGELVTGSGAVLGVSFANTREEQRFEVYYIARPVGDASRVPSATRATSPDAVTSPDPA